MGSFEPNDLELDFLHEDAYNYLQFINENWKGYRNTFIYDYQHGFSEQFWTQNQNLDMVIVISD